MNINEEVYFSPSVKLAQVAQLSDEVLLNSYRERIQSWYIDAAERLNSIHLGFASSVILFSLLDALARLFIRENKLVGVRIKEFSKKYLNASEEQSRVLYEIFRNGVIHEGRIDGAHFSYSMKMWILIEEKQVIVNPSLFCEKLSIAIDDLFGPSLEASQNLEIIQRIRSDFSTAP